MTEGARENLGVLPLLIQQKQLYEKTASGVWLVVLAIMAGLMWRGEVEFHGWYGLEWIDHGIVSIFGALVLLAGWLFFVSSPSIRKTGGWLFLGAVIASVPLRTFLFVLSSFLFMAGPGAIGREFFGGPVVTGSVSIIIFLLFPCCLYWGGRRLGCRTSWRYLGIAYSLYVLSWPICCGILALIKHPGSPDLIHAIKSGLIVPFLFAGTAILLYDSPARIVNDKEYGN